jgi:hypothetical protein
MAKKSPRSGKPTPGGRVTPKGVRPDGPTSRHEDDDAAATPDAPRVVPPRIDPTHGRQPGGHLGPTRSGHHHGQR